MILSLVPLIFGLMGLLIQLQTSSTEEEVEGVFDSPEFGVLMELSGSRRVPCVSNTLYFCQFYYYSIRI